MRAFENAEPTVQHRKNPFDNDNETLECIKEENGFIWKNKASIVKKTQLEKRLQGAGNGKYIEIRLLKFSELEIWNTRKL